MNPYDLINTTNAVKPNYDLSAAKLSFDIRISFTGDICVMGRLDNNYICGCSFSSTEDESRTQRIIDGIADSFGGSLISHEYRVLGLDLWEKMRDWYEFYVYLSPDYSDGQYFTFSDSEYHFQRKDMTKAIMTAYKNLLRKCDARLADNLYLPVMQGQYELLSKYKRDEKEAPGYYSQMKPLIEIVEQEAYLKLSPHHDARGLYLRIAKCCGDLYGAYMAEVR